MNKKTLAVFRIIMAMGSLSACVEKEEPKDYKPVIYLYPVATTEVSVKLSCSDRFTCTYPTYGTGWNVVAHPDGTLYDKADGKEYSYLFWEVESRTEYDMSKGFVVKGEDTETFLQEKLSFLGLTPKEYNEFIVFWLPKMQENPYNLITFQEERYTQNAKMEVMPKPDSILRVFMAYKALQKPIQIQEPSLKRFERKGFSVVEWGGTQMMN